MTGQMSLFDFVGEEEKKDFDIPMPNVGEYDKETMLAFEKEVLGIYVSRHPLEKYEERWRKSITAVTADFQWDDEVHAAKVHDGARAVIGGMLAGKKRSNIRKTTR